MRIQQGRSTVMTTIEQPRVKVRPEVEEGAALLDMFRPGWEHQVNLGNLQLNDCTACVLGQLWGHYDDGCRALGFSWASSEPDSFGFFTKGEQEDWDKLTEEWRDLIASRR